MFHGTLTHEESKAVITYYYCRPSNEEFHANKLMLLGGEIRKCFFKREITIMVRSGACLLLDGTTPIFHVLVLYQKTTNKR
jgi:hypothetical protein